MYIQKSMFIIRCFARPTAKGEPTARAIVPVTVDKMTSVLQPGKQLVRLQTGTYRTQRQEACLLASKHYRRTPVVIDLVSCVTGWPADEVSWPHSLLC